MIKICEDEKEFFYGEPHFQWDYYIVSQSLDYTEVLTWIGKTIPNARDNVVMLPYTDGPRVIRFKRNQDLILVKLKWD